MQFADIPGLNELKHQLTSAHARGKVAHAQLFSGRPGTAALPMALAYASYLMCQNRTESDSCGTCPNCVRIKKLIHPDIHFFFPKISASDRGKYEKVLSEFEQNARQIHSKRGLKGVWEVLGATLAGKMSQKLSLLTLVDLARLGSSTISCKSSRMAPS